MGLVENLQAEPVSRLALREPVTASGETTIREAIDAFVDVTQKNVSCTVKLKLYKGNVIVIGRKSGKSLYSDEIVTFEDDQGAYDQKDAEGFIKLNALRLRTLEMRNRRT